MTRTVFWLVVGIVLLASRSARADEVHGAVGPVVELGHRVTVTMHRGYAVWDAERHLSSQGAGQAILPLDLPVVGDGAERTQAVAVGLRLFDGKVWRDGSLQEAEAASTQYFDGGGSDEAAALLASGLGMGQATVRVSGMHPGIRRDVGYRLVMPTRYEGGHYRLVLPATPEDEQVSPQDPHAAMAPTIVPRGVGGALVVNGQPWPDGEPIRFDPRRGLELSLRPPVAGWTVDGALVVIPFGKRFLTHAHIEVVPELSQPPRGARVVLVVDASRSLEDAMLDGACAAARAYLDHLPDAEVEVVTFARETRRRFGRFVSAAVAAQDLASWRPVKENSSEIGPALTLASELLERGRSEQPKRIVVLTDGKMRHDLEVETLAERFDSASPPITQIVHVMPAHRGRGAMLARDDEGAWAEVAGSTGGLAWTGRFPVGVEPQEDLAPVVEQLVRPTKLSHFQAESAPFFDTSLLFVPSELGEGEGTSLTVMLDTPLPWLTVKGKRWHDEVSFTLPVHDAEIPVWAALAFGGDALPLDDDIARLQLARRGGAVTDLTSYVVGRTVEPPVAERMGFGSFSGRSGFSTRCGGFGRGVSFEGREWLEIALRQALYACGADQHRATVSLETIGREVAQVDGVKVTSVDAPPGLASCLHEATWALDLPVKDFDGRPSRRWEVLVKAIMP